MATKLTGDYVNGRGKGTVMREFPDFGPGDTAADRHRLVEDFKNSCYIWYTDRWRSYFKAEPSFFPPVADSAAEMRDMLDTRLAASIPHLKAVLREAEQAAQRINTRNRN